MSEVSGTACLTGVFNEGRLGFGAWRSSGALGEQSHKATNAGPGGRRAAPSARCSLPEVCRVGGIETASNVSSQKRKEIYLSPLADLYKDSRTSIKVIRMNLRYTSFIENE